MKITNEIIEQLNREILSNNLAEDFCTDTLNDIILQLLSGDICFESYQELLHYTDDKIKKACRRYQAIGYVYPDKEYHIERFHVRYSTLPHHEVFKRMLSPQEQQFVELSETSNNFDEIRTRMGITVNHLHVISHKCKVKYLKFAPQAESYIEGWEALSKKLTDPTHCKIAYLYSQGYQVDYIAKMMHLTVRSVVLLLFYLRKQHGTSVIKWKKYC